ncbi:ADC synthase [Aspergillus steynii IBT 23096]|uniref:ADC synthase n=1 Tax=Aspergillus steynii IBT 23096 TaxID=1392250 RepID=A0A2I2GL53_9EURO|nr:ADC synthase [Aspergillus steynii IBT 23096]PLB53579.1 ADC synthase [Aspergillus steynii IBT 23096]
MPSHIISFDLDFAENVTLERVAMVLSRYKECEHYAYERADTWSLGLGTHASFMIDAKGEIATITTGARREEHPVGDSLAQAARDFLSQHAQPDHKVFGQVGFNYAAHTQGMPFKPGSCPLLSLLVPRVEVLFHRDQITLTGPHDTELKELSTLIMGDAALEPHPGSTIDTGDPAGEYVSQVQRAQADIAGGKYTKVVPSRAVRLSTRVDMAATLLCGRQANDPARSFSLSQGGFQATGFSPELVMSVREGIVATEPLAGTRSRLGSAAEVEKLTQELTHDPKEIMEHVMSVKEAMEELNRLCVSGTVTTDDFMSVRPRGSVQHLGSRVSGTLTADKDPWDALGVTFPSITASGIPKRAALEGIQRLENRPRELYSGAVLMLDGPDSFEASLVLRTVFQDPHRAWIQAGAGVIAQSSPDRELTETREKLASIAPFVVTEATPVGLCSCGEGE